MAGQRFTGIRRQLRKKVPVSGEGSTGFTTVPDGYEEAVIDVDVDLAAIARLLGTKAMGNSKGVSKYLQGLVTVRVISRARAS